MLDLNTLLLYSTEGTPDPVHGFPPYRYKQSAVVYNDGSRDSVYMYGGRNGRTTLGDLWQLTADNGDVPSFSVRDKI